MLEKRLKLLRSEKKETQDEIAQKLNISRARYSQYELGTRTPDNDLLVKIADLFNVSADYLLGKIDFKNYGQEWDDETIELMEELHKRPELKILFKASSKATKEDIEKIAKMVKVMAGEDDDF